MKSKLSNLAQTAILGTALISQTEQTVLSEDANQQKTRLSASITLEVQSQYFFRGLRFSNKNKPVVWQTINGTAEFSNGTTATLSYFGNHNIHTGKYDEADILGNVTRSFGPVTATIGGGFYHSPTSSWKNTAEVTAGLSLNHEKIPFTTLITGGYDFVDANAGFIEVGVSKGIPLNKSKTAPSLEVSATTGLNFHYFTGKDGLAYTALKATLNVPLTDSLSLRPSVMKQISHRNDFESPFVASLGLNYTFK